jgi:hypothetical protein
MTTRTSSWLANTTLRGLGYSAEAITPEDIERHGGSGQTVRWIHEIMASFSGSTCLLTYSPRQELPSGFLVVSRDGKELVGGSLVRPRLRDPGNVIVGDFGRARHSQYGGDAPGDAA